MSEPFTNVSSNLTDELVLRSNLNLGLEVVDEATSPAPPLPFDVAFTASFNAAVGFVASSTYPKIKT